MKHLFFKRLAILMWSLFLVFSTAACGVAQSGDSGSDRTIGTISGTPSAGGSAMAQDDNITTPGALPPGFIEEDVTVGAGDWAVKGKLTLPKQNADGKLFPVVVLVSGSGPNDMDETLYRNKPFRDIAQGLASQGVASLRYNKITKENPKLLEPYATTLTANEEYLPNVHDALALLETDTRIDKARVFVLGHSLGGTVIPRINKAEPLPAGYIFMAGSNAFLADELLRQYHYLFGLDGKIDSDEKTAIQQVEMELAKLHAMLDGTDKATSTPILGAPVSYWIDLYAKDPLKAAADIRKPVLVLQGDRDYNVLPESAEKWQTALTGSKDVTVKHYPALNHLMLSGKGPDDPLNLMTPQTVDAGLISDLAAWVLAH